MFRVFALLAAPIFVGACGRASAVPSQPTAVPAVVGSAIDAAIAGERIRIAAAVGVPTNLAAAVNRNTVTLTWTAPPGEAVTAYTIDAGSAPAASDLASGLPTGSATTTFSTQVRTGTYYARVRTVTALGQSAPSNEVTFVVAGSSCAAAPAVVS